MALQPVRQLSPLLRDGDDHGTGKTGHDLGSATTRASAFDELLRRIQAHGGQID